MGKTFTYDGILCTDMGVKYRTSTISLLPPAEAKTITVPGRPGGYYYRSEYGMRKIQIDVYIEYTDSADLKAKVRQIAAWLQPVAPKPLVLDDEPGITYYAVLDGTTDLERMAVVGTGTLTFICPDPMGYGAIQTPTIDITQVNAIQNTGTAEAYPLLTITFKQNTEFFAYSNGRDHVYLGSAAADDIEQTIDANPVKLDDPCETLTGWSTAAGTDYSTVTGSMMSDGAVIKASSYGSGSGWHGPAVLKSLAQPLQDFQVDFWVGNHNVLANKANMPTLKKGSKGSAVKQLQKLLGITQDGVFGTQTENALKNYQQSHGLTADGVCGPKTWASLLGVTTQSKQMMGHAQLALLDINNAQFARLSIADSYSKAEDMYAILGCGRNGNSYNLIASHGKKAGYYNDFYGLLRLSRKGNKWAAYLGQWDEDRGKLVKVMTKTWVDTHNTWTAPKLATLQLSFSQYGSNPVSNMYCARIVVKDLSPNVSSTQKEYIAKAGDVITVDHYYGEVRRNGVVHMELVDPTSRFFSIPANDWLLLDFQPADSAVADVSLSYQERWL